jgi:hypothetical protein
VSDNAYGTGFARRIREWDDYVEDHDREQAVKPFDGGVMLAVATLFELWGEDPKEPGWRDQVDWVSFVDAMKGLRETVEQVIE